MNFLPEKTFDAKRLWPRSAADRARQTEAERDPEWPALASAFGAYEAAELYGTPAEAACAWASFVDLDRAVYRRAHRRPRWQRAARKRAAVETPPEVEIALSAPSPIAVGRFARALARLLVEQAAREVADA
jgi:hypothetical protein